MKRPRLIKRFIKKLIKQTIKQKLWFGQANYLLKYNVKVIRLKVT